MSKTNNRVVIGMDPHKRSVTIEVMTAGIWLTSPSPMVRWE